MGALINSQILAPLSDPNWASVVFLGHFDGADNATSATDSSAAAHTITFSGTARLDTGVAKYGTAALEIPAGGDHINMAASSDWSFGTSPGTWEGWAYVPALNVSHPIFTIAGTDGFSLQAGGAVGGGGGQYVTWSKAGVDVYGATVITTNTWHHFAAVFTGSRLRLYLDGVKDYDAAFTDTVGNASSTARIGIDGGASGNAAWYDDVRITKGVARYDSSFTPPSAAFPNF